MSLVIALINERIATIERMIHGLEVKIKENYNKIAALAESEIFNKQAIEYYREEIKNLQEQREEILQKTTLR